MTKWTQEGEDAYREGFKHGLDAADDPSGVIAVVTGALGGFIFGLIVATLVHWLS